MKTYSLQDSRDLYGIDNWGAGYFDILPSGHLMVRPVHGESQSVDVKQVVDELVARGISTPILLRFPQILASQVERLSGAFARAVEEFGYRSVYSPVFPVKVNQRKEVIQDLLRSGRRFRLGLEAGSRAEILIAMAQDAPAGSLLVCNGFKDAAYLVTASLGMQLGHKVVVVLEKPFEVENLLRMADQLDPVPYLGLRVKLHSRGSGRWEKSGGAASKFGLSASQILQGIDKLREAGLLDRLCMLHFHIGSQVTEIRRIKTAIQEASRIYAKLRKMGVEINLLNVGGGLGVDYDGSRTSSDASVNYTVQEFANDVVYNIKDICKREEVPEPEIVSESGRALTAYHSMLITDVVAAVTPNSVPAAVLDDKDPPVVQELGYIRDRVNPKNHREFWHDALQQRDELLNRFNLGYLSLEDRAKGESLFWEVAHKAVRFAKHQKYVSEELENLEHHLSSKYICNFSVFQSIPDSWALEQLFPVVPIHRLHQQPTCMATLVDITCDSDGEIDRFVDLKDIKESLEVHPLHPGEPYYLGVLLIGAYQDVMGDYHNLFGAVNEAHICVEPDGKHSVRTLLRGDTVRQVSQIFGHDPDALSRHVEGFVEMMVREGRMEKATATRINASYRQELSRYTYLDRNNF
ncbi:MAG: biosynthetic arginine decarboxylase [Acidobacteria bacterium]|nr:MAG: biosynthetic arginine decarboxylase [Acidobacteriota bacterium]